MELHAPIPFPPASSSAEDAALTEIDVAIALVVGGSASRVRVAGIAARVTDAIAGVGAARAGAAGVRFVERSPYGTTFTIGPRA